MDIMSIYEAWLSHVPENDSLYNDLLSLRGKDAEIEERFGSVIAFGTAGLRGIYGAGTIRMNRYTVGRATQGIADYILSSGEDPSRGVALAYDARYHSEEFAQEAAAIFAKNHIPSFLFPSIRPTPELSFTIRTIGALSGINMTASHNPKEYNGYKVYWKDGAQISGDIGDGMAQSIESISWFEGPHMDIVHMTPEETAAYIQADDVPVTILTEEADEDYYRYVLSLQERADDVLDKTISVVYTPLHGCGAIPAREVLGRAGYQNVSYVESQMIPDPAFTKAPFPNPEDPRAFEEAEKLGRETDATLLIATDPDADRMAICVRADDGSYQFLNGNQTGALLIAYLADAQKEAGTLHDRDGKEPVMIKSIVTGDLGRAICDAYGIRTVEALTGFKYICGRIPELEEEGYRLFFAYEESIGCAPDPSVRDKDGIAAALLLCEMAAYHQKQGRTLLDVLHSLYATYGYYAEKQVSLVLEGAAGKERIARMMDAFRAAAKEGRLPGSHPSLPAPSEIIDYENGYEDIPPSNVLKYTMGEDGWLAVRPSGTEPKIKFYFNVRGTSPEKAEAILSSLSDGIMTIAEAIE